MPKKRQVRDDLPQGIEMLEGMIDIIGRAIEAVLRGEVSDPDRLVELIEKRYGVVKGYFKNVLGIDLDADSDNPPRWGKA